jgi:Lrp/AsnC family transcriptional regulator
MGAADHLLKIVVPSVEAYEKFFREKLSQLPAVREANSAIALAEVKSTTALPL